MPDPIKPTQTARPADARDEVIAEMRKALSALSAEMAALKHAANEPPRPEKVPLVTAKDPWAEEIWVEALRDCTYPDPHDYYAKYRLGRREGVPGERFRLAHREHLDARIHREIKPGDPDQAMPVEHKPIPQTAARGVRGGVLPL